MADFTTLTETFSRSIKIYQDYLHAAGLPLPSHKVAVSDQKAANPSVHPLPDNVAAALEDAKEASRELHMLLISPVELVTDCVPNFSRTLTLNFIARYGIAEKLAPGETKSFKALADECNLDENDLRRMLRLAMTDHIFDEPELNIVAHTKASLALATVPNLSAWAEGFTSSCASMTELPEAIGKWPGSEKANETAGALYRKQKGFSESLWEHYQQHPELAIRFGKAMEFISSNPAVNVTGFVREYDFSQLPADATFVDVGGSHGKAAIAVAEAHPKIHCIVQDISSPVINAARTNLSPHLKDRVEFQVYDFWTEQPIKGADVYFFRWIFHDWSDTDSVKLLKNLVPSLKPGSRIVINDRCLPSHGESTPYKQRQARIIDMMMKSLANAKERDAQEWKALFDAADPRFRFQPINRPPKLQHAIIEAIWDP